MENPGSEIHDWDWEVVTSNNTENEDGGADEGRKSPSCPSSGGGVIQSDYFSVDYAATATKDAAATAYSTTVGVVGSSDEGEEGGDSDNPSWVDPSGSSVLGGTRKRSRSPNSSSASSDSSDRLLSLVQPHSSCCGGGFDCKDHLEDAPVTSEGELHDAVAEDEGEELKDGEQGVDHQLSPSNFQEKKRMVWWKVPLEVLKYCVLRVNPVWSLSMAAAALMGFVILRRRYLSKMKRKTQGIKLNVTLDDKKVSQFMSRAARLNEAFSVVKRVPIIRPALAAPGMAPWPVMSLR